MASHSFDNSRRSLLSVFVAAMLVLATVFVAPVSAGGHRAALRLGHVGKSRIDAGHTSYSRRAQLKRRFDGARFTFFKTGLGNCGGWNVDDDWIVAINTPQWAGGSHCGETVTITIGGKTARATVVDRCVECPFGALDFSIGLIRYFDSNYEETGTLYGSWHFGGSAPETTTTTTTSRTRTTSSTTTTSTWTSSTTRTTTSSTTTTTSSSTATTRSTTTTESSTTPTPTSTETTASLVPTTTSSTPPVATATGGALDQLHWVIVEMGSVVSHGPGSS